MRSSLYATKWSMDVLFNVAEVLTLFYFIGSNARASFSAKQYQVGVGFCQSHLMLTAKAREQGDI